LEAPLLPGLSLPDRHERHDRLGEVVYMTRPLEREGVLSGFTYKIRWPGSDHALYITINDIERDHAEGVSSTRRRRPFEVFINTKNLEHYAWTVALTRMISAIFRRGGDVSFVVEELKAIFDPQGGQWMGGRYVPSLIAAIGQVIEGHMVRTGFIGPPRQPGQEAETGRLAEALGAPRGDAGQAPGETDMDMGTGRVCPRCGSRSLHRREACWVCSACDYSKCG
jgi:ribonucleoside-diphosphate reductase alpha chain